MEEIEKGKQMLTFEKKKDRNSEKSKFFGEKFR